MKKSINPLEKSDYELIYITKSKYEGDWSYSVHSHPFMKMLFILDGTGQISIQGGTIPLKKNNLIVVNPNVSHAEVLSAEKDLRYYAIGVGKLVMENEHHSPLFLHLPNYRAESRFFNVSLDYLYDEFKFKRDGYEEICNNVLNNLFVELSRLTNLGVTPCEDSRETSEVALAKNYIDKNFADDISLDLLAQVTQTSKYYLAHSFKDAYGVSPIRYLISKRINVAKDLLDRTDHQISSIAEFVGFSSPSYFTQAFNRETGYSPNEYRNLDQD